MNTHLSPLCCRIVLLMSAALLPMHSHAANFCAGASSSASSVALGATSAAALATAGTTVRTNVTFYLTGICFGSAPFSSYIYLQATGGSSVDTATNNLTNTGTATNVELQIVSNDNNRQILLSKGVGQQSEYHSTAKDYFYTYTVNYYATGRATAGTVKAGLAFTVEYP